MFLVEMDVPFGPKGPRLSDDEITDLIEALVEELDHLPVEPSVGSTRVDDDVELTVGVVVEDDDQFAALRHGAAVIGAGLHAVLGRDVGALMVQRADGVRSRVLTAA